MKKKCFISSTNLYTSLEGNTSLNFMWTLGRGAGVLRVMHFEMCYILKIFKLAFTNVMELILLEYSVNVTDVTLKAQGVEKKNTLV